MANLKYYDFKIKGEEQERLLDALKGIIASKKIDFLPSNTKQEINNITQEITNIKNQFKKFDSNVEETIVLSGGRY